MALIRNILGTVNFVGILLSIPLIAAGAWLVRKQDTECVKFLEWPVILLGVFLFLISLSGLVGALWRITYLISIYLFGIVLLILLLLALSIFGLVVTNDGPAANSGYRTYHVQDYSSWLRGQVNDVLNWRKIKHCLRDQGICEKLQENYYYTSGMGFYNARLSSIEYGCCMPPPDCGFQYVNPTFWIYPNVNSDDALAEPDCSRWSNVETELCYECDSCRAGLLAVVKEEWRKVAVLNLVIVIGLIVLYVIACTAVQSAPSEATIASQKAVT